jgi:GNAT superfamily N-acetyltransferase
MGTNACVRRACDTVRRVDSKTEHTLRAARTGDLDAYVALRAALWPDCPAEDHASEAVACLTPLPGRGAFVAVTPGGVIAGFVELALRPWAEGVDSRPTAFVEGLFVLPEARRRGLARRLLDAADAWAGDHGSSALGSDAELHNVESQALHLAVGFVEQERTVVYARPVRSPIRHPAVTQGDLLGGVPESLTDELFTPLCFGANVRVERIVSRGHASPPGFWYCQDEDEFVLLVSGGARLEIEGRGELALRPGQWIDLPRGVRHRVAFTEPGVDTIWLAVFRGG